MLSKTALHALKAFAVLSELPPGAFAGAGTIAMKIAAGPNYLGKLLQSFIDEGLVLSQKGMGGGFRLARDPREITVFEVVEPVDHVSRWEGCFMGKVECSEESPCLVHDRWLRVREEYLSFLKETTIGDLLRKPNLRIPTLN